MKLFRKTIALILAAALLVMCRPQRASAITIWVYELSGGNAVITMYNGAEGTVTLPTVLDGHPVIAIKDEAFKNNAVLSKVTIPGCITTIGASAFEGCNRLTTVTMENGVATIGHDAFTNCSALTTVQLPPSLISIGYNGFFHCTSLVRIALPNSVTHIGTDVFSGCTALADVTLPAHLTAIPDFMFNGCTSLPYFAIPESITNIGTAAFNGCTRMTMITVPASVSTVNAAAFSGCTALVRAMFFGPRPTLGANVFDGTPSDFILCYHVTQHSWTSYGTVTMYPFCNSTYEHMDGTLPEHCLSMIFDGHVDNRTPTRLGYTFLGWYKEAACLTPWNFTTEFITDDYTAYAKWKLTEPDAPASVTAVSASYNSVKLQWAAAANATGYEVWRAASSGGAYTKVGSTTGTSFTNTGLITNRSYWYKVRSVNQRGSNAAYSSFATVSPASVKPIPATPANVKATRASSKSIKITWNSVAGAAKYEVWRAETASGTYKKITTTTAKNYLNTGLTTGKTYFYKVRAYRLVGGVKVYGLFCPSVGRKP